MALHRYPNTWRVHGNHPLHAEIRSAFDRFVGADGDGSSAATNAWTPRVDIKEESARFVILADVPGVDPKDIEITMDKGVLSIKGERKAETVAENGKLTRAERSNGAFDRRFALPDSADAEGIQAVGKHGVLEVSIPKRPELAPRRIAVN
jgi:HSP20 family protein